MNAAYDLHIHSCLSPCADNDMTPNNIVNMAKLKGLDMIAVTDHNACGNCAAAMRAGERAGLLVLPGMELCTAEDIHVVCLFCTLEGALAFEREVQKTLPPIPNRPDIFGEQLFLDENDEPTGAEERYLLAASGIPVEQVPALCRAHGGAAFPAHADKTANGVLAVLGVLPAEAGFRAAELSANCADAAAFVRENPSLRGLRVLRDSDAHMLGTIAEREHFLELERPGREELVALLGGY